MNLARLPDVFLFGQIRWWFFGTLTFQSERR